MFTTLQTEFESRKVAQPAQSTKDKTVQTATYNPNFQGTPFSGQTDRGGMLDQNLTGAFSGIDGLRFARRSPQTGNQILLNRSSPTDPSKFNVAYYDPSKPFDPNSLQWSQDMTHEGINWGDALKYSALIGGSLLGAQALAGGGFGAGAGAGAAGAGTGAAGAATNAALIESALGTAGYGASSAGLGGAAGAAGAAGAGNALGGVSGMLGGNGNLLSLGGNLLNSFIGYKASNDAADAQIKSAQEANALAKYMYDTTRKDNMPALDARNAGLTGYQNLLQNPSQITSDPGYQFGLQQGINAYDNSGAARGMRLSGGQAKALTKFGQDYGQTKFNESLNRYGNLAGLGQTGTGTIANAGMNYANTAGANMTGAGNAAASGYIGGANAITGGISNFLKGWQENQLLKQLGLGG